MRGIVVALLVTVAGMGTSWAGFERPETAPPPSGRDEGYDVVARLFTGYDSNVQFYNDFLLPAAPQTGAALLGLSARASGQHQVGEDLFIGGSLRGDIVRYDEGIPKARQPQWGKDGDYDLDVIQSNAYLAWFTSLEDGTAVSLSGAYGLRRERSRDVAGIGELSNQLGATANFDTPGPWSYQVSLIQTFDDFDVKFPFDPLSDRDGNFTEFAFTPRYEIDGAFFRAVSATLAYETNSAGKNWSYDGFLFAGHADMHISGPVYGELGASYSDRSYAGGFTSLGWPAPGRTTLRISTIEAKLYWTINPRTTLDLAVSDITVDSNSTFFDAGRTLITLGLTRRLL